MHLALPVGALTPEKRMEIAVDPPLEEALERNAERGVKIPHRTQEALARRLQSILEHRAQMTLTRRTEEEPLKPLEKFFQNRPVALLCLQYHLIHRHFYSLTFRRGTGSS